LRRILFCGLSTVLAGAVGPYVQHRGVLSSNQSGVVVIVGSIFGMSVVVTLAMCFMGVNMIVVMLAAMVM
jgi:hypothetical protein